MHRKVYSGHCLRVLPGWGFRCRQEYVTELRLAGGTEWRPGRGLLALARHGPRGRARTPGGTGGAGQNRAEDDGRVAFSVPVGGGRGRLRRHNARLPGDARLPFRAQGCRNPECRLAQPGRAVVLPRRADSVPARDGSVDAGAGSSRARGGSREERVTWRITRCAARAAPHRAEGRETGAAAARLCRCARSPPGAAPIRPAPRGAYAALIRAVRRIRARMPAK